MTEKKNRRALPPHIIPEARKFIEGVIDRQESGSFENVDITYGHAAGGLAQSILGNSRDKSPEEQRRLMREKAQKYVKIYGPGIIAYLRDEFKLALED